MHKRKGALADSPALFSLKLCIFFAFSCPFFMSFSVLLYPFSILFRLFISSLPFCYPFISLSTFFLFSSILFPPFRLLYSTLFRFIFSNHLFLFLISYPLYVLCISFCTSLYFTFYLFFAFILALFTGFTMY